MRYIALLVALPLILLCRSSSAQDDTASSLVHENSSLQQELILQNTREILRRLDAQPAPATSSRKEDPTVEGLTKRLAEIEKKLAEAPAVPPEAAAPAEAASKAGTNAIWIITAGALVFFMQAGFCLLELGLTRPKNAINICMKNALDFSAGAICFLFIGFALMFGASQGGGGRDGAILVVGHRGW